ncbi:MAG: nucleotidyltransferase domain-containing protein [bacterium]
MNTAIHKDWEITPEKVEEVIRRIVENGRPLKIILFGSYINGRIDRDSDLDILIVGRNEIRSARKESVRIRRFLRGISMPMDIIVVPETEWERLKEQPGLIYREAMINGKVVHESAEQENRSRIA